MVVAFETQLFTIDDLQKLDGDFELDRGALVAVNPAFKEHGFVCSEVSARIRGHVRRHQLGSVYCNDTGFVLEHSPDTLRGPDVAFVRRDRSDATPSNAFAEGGPDLAVEVVSGTGSLPEAIRKAAQYLESGTALVWIVDIGHRRAIVFDREGVVQTLDENTALDGGEVLPGFRVVVRELLDGEPAP